MRKNFNKKNILAVLIILVISLLSVYSYLSNRLNIGHDAFFHMNRIYGLANAFEEKQILPKIYPYANYDFGYASPLFYCDLFLYPFATMCHFGVGNVICYKAAIIFYVFIGNILTYFVIRKITNNNIISYIGLILYSLSNYHIQNILIRSAFGELLAMSFLPLVVYAVYKILILKKDSWILLGASFSLIVMSHLISTLLLSGLFGVLLIVHIVINRKNISQIKKILLTVIKGTILALFITAWYLIPMLEQFKDQTFWLTENAKRNDLSGTTQEFTNLFKVFACTKISNFDVIKQSSAGIVLLLTSLMYVFVKKNKYINILIIIIIFLYSTLFGILPYKYLNIIQYLFRLYIVITPLLTIISIYSMVCINKQILNRIILLLISCFGIINIFLINQETLNKKYLFLFNDASKEDISSDINSKRYVFNQRELAGAEYLPCPNGYINFKEETPAIKYIDNNKNKIDSIWDYDREFTRIEFSCNYNDDKTLIIPLTYYKGYKGYELIDGKYEEIDLYDYEEFKELAIDSTAGSHTYMVKYEGTFIQKLTLVISSLSSIGLIIYLVRKRYHN